MGSIRGVSLRVFICIRPRIYIASILLLGLGSHGQILGDVIFDAIFLLKKSFSLICFLLFFKLFAKFQNMIINHEEIRHSSKSRLEFKPQPW